jgi:hypothetical protein
MWLDAIRSKASTADREALAHCPNTGTHLHSRTIGLRVARFQSRSELGPLLTALAVDEVASKMLSGSFSLLTGNNAGKIFPFGSNPSPSPNRARHGTGIYSASIRESGGHLENFFPTCLSLYQRYPSTPRADTTLFPKTPVRIEVFT